MIEIFALIALTKKIASMAQAKGRSAKLFRALTEILWVFNEISFVVIAIRLLGVRSTPGVVTAALAGGAIGGLISFLIVKFIPAGSNTGSSDAPAEANPSALWTEPTTVECTACGATVKLPALFCDTCGAKIENNLG